MIEVLMQPAVLALIGTIFGGVGLKIAESLLTKSKNQSDLAAEIRKELRTDVQALRTEIRTVEAEVDKWRGKYYEVVEELYMIKKRLSECDDHRTEFHTKKEEDSTTA